MAVVALLAVKTYYKATVIRHALLAQRLEQNLETDLFIYIDLICEKGVPAELWEKAFFSINGLGNIGFPHRNKKNKLDKYFTP